MFLHYNWWICSALLCMKVDAGGCCCDVILVMMISTGVRCVWGGADHCWRRDDQGEAGPRSPLSPLTLSVSECWSRGQCHTWLLTNTCWQACEVVKLSASVSDKSRWMILITTRWKRWVVFKFSLKYFDTFLYREGNVSQ